MMGAWCLLIGATLLTGGSNGLTYTLESKTEVIDPSRNVFVSLTVTAPHDVVVTLPDLRERVRGFSQVEDFEDPVKTVEDGSLVYTTHWQLTPEPCAEYYKIAPFVVAASPRLLSSQSDAGSLSFIVGPVAFANPSPREPVTGGMECDPRRDLPPLSWKLVGYGALVLLALAALLWVVAWGVRALARRVKEHRMSPIERAWVELDRLLKKGLPGRGRYKDFYVELTMVVRRYIQRKYGIRAPHLTTEEFLAKFRDEGRVTSDELRKFLESSDLVKFAGIEATPDMTDAATESARTYLKGDAAEKEAAI